MHLLARAALLVVKLLVVGEGLKQAAGMPAVELRHALPFMGLLAPSTKAGVVAVMGAAEVEAIPAVAAAAASGTAFMVQGVAVAAGASHLLMPLQSTSRSQAQVVLGRLL